MTSSFFENSLFGWKLSPVSHRLAIIFFPARKLSFHFVYEFLYKARVNKLISPHLFLLLFLFPWETDLRKHWQNVYVRMFWLYSLLGVLGVVSRI